MKPTIHTAVQGVHMGKGHEGLALLLKKNLKIDVRTLPENELIICLNRVGDKMKIIGGGGLVVGYLKLPGGSRISLDALQYIPQTFGGAGFNYDAAVKKLLAAKLPSYGAMRHWKRPGERAQAAA